MGASRAQDAVPSRLFQVESRGTENAEALAGLPQRWRVSKDRRQRRDRASSPVIGPRRLFFLVAARGVKGDPNDQGGNQLRRLRGIQAGIGAGNGSGWGKTTRGRGDIAVHVQRRIAIDHI